MKQNTFLLASMAAAILAACSVMEPPKPSEDLGEAHLRVNVTAYDFLPFETRAALTLSEVSTRMSYALFRMDGERMMNTKSAESGSEGYGTIDVRLQAGQYILVTVAHNGTGNCTISSPTEVKFEKSHVTDTFTSCDTITVAEGDQVATIRLSRRVAMLRLVLDETLPEVVTQMKLYYTGGSSTLDASTGRGCVNSRQTELFTVPASAYDTEGSTYEAYTFPHEEADTLKLVITALDASGVSVSERTLADVPVKRGQITQFRGSIKGSSTQFGFTIDDTEWTQSDYTF